MSTSGTPSRRAPGEVRAVSGNRESGTPRFRSQGSDTFLLHRLSRRPRPGNRGPGHSMPPRTQNPLRHHAPALVCGAVCLGLPAVWQGPLGERVRGPVKRAGIEIVCIRMPVASELLPIEEAAFPSRLFEDLCRSSDVPLRDYSRAPYATCDGSHMQWSEATRFTQQLADDLTRVADW